MIKAKKGMEHGGKKFFVNDDLTREEELIQYKARCFAKNHKGKNKAIVAYRKVYIEGKEFRWNEELTDFVERI